VYIDLNFALHYCIYNTTNETQLFTKLYAFIDSILANLTTTNVIFATDSAPPLAKLMLQRKRRSQLARYKSMNILNPLWLTTGTNFMMNLRNKINFNIIEQKYNVHTITLFDEIDGEAELKIVKHIKDTSEATKNNKNLIFSSDSDIVVMSMFLIEFKSNQTSIHIGCKEKNVTQIFDMNQFVDSFNENFRDIAVLFLLTGNDYFPKLTSVNVENLLISYARVSSFSKFKKTRLLTDDGVNIDFLREILIHLSIHFTTKQMLKKFSFANMKISMYKNYIDGINWCLSMYSTCVCDNYGYMYKFNTSPHQLGLFYYLTSTIDIKITPNNKMNELSKPIANDIYAIFILPHKAINLINPKYHDVINKKLQQLYEEENCNICNQLHDKITTKKDYMFGDNTNNTNNNDNNSVYEINKTLKDHKNVHAVITPEIIEKLLGYLRKIK